MTVSSGITTRSKVLAGAPLALMLALAYGCRDHEPASYIALDSPASMDLGRLAADTVASRTVGVKNIWTGPLTFEIERKSCGCIDVEPASFELKPGEVGNVAFSVAVPLEPHRQSHTVQLSVRRSDAGDTVDRLYLGMAFTPDLPFLVLPNRLDPVMFVEETWNGRIVIRKLGETSLRVTGVSIESELVEWDKPHVSDVGDEVIEIGLSGRALGVGVENSSYVEIRSTHSKFETMRVPLNTRVRQRVETRPDSIGLSRSVNDARVSVVISREFHLERNHEWRLAGADWLHLVDVSYPDEGERSPVTFALRFKPGAPPSGNDILQSGDGKIAIPIRWY